MTLTFGNNKLDVLTRHNFSDNSVDNSVTNRRFLIPKSIIESDTYWYDLTKNKPVKNTNINKLHFTGRVSVTF